MREGYLDNLLKLGGVTREEADQIAVERRARLDQALEANHVLEREKDELARLLQVERRTGQRIVTRPGYRNPDPVNRTSRLYLLYKSEGDIYLMYLSYMPFRDF